MDLSALFHCRSVAVVGASRDPQKVGHQILASLKKNSDLRLVPVNPSGEDILGLHSVRSLSELGNPVDVAIIAIPFSLVEKIIDECIRVQVKAIVVISAGFAETNEEGREVQQRIMEKVNRAGILLLGPNTMGYIVPSRNLFASFGARDSTAGPIAVISQSGAMLSAIFQEFASAKTGVSFAVSLGNRAGVDENACLEYAEQDPNTRAIALYLESFSDIPQLLTLASRIVKKKPIFLLKGGTTQQGVTAAVSHTAALATPQVLLQDAARQAGIVLVENFEQFVRATVAVAKTTFLPEHLMVVTNAGGPAVVLADETEKAGIMLAKLSTETKEHISTTFPKLHISNPLDLLGDAKAEDFAQALDVLSRDLTIDAIACIVTQQSVTDMAAITQVLAKPRGKRVILACIVGGDQLEEYRRTLKSAGVLVVRYPNEAVETMQALAQARAFMEKTELFVLPNDVKANKHYPETFLDLQKLLSEYGLQFPLQMIVEKESDLELLKTLQFPLFAKTTDMKLKHKAKLGGVIAHIETFEQAREAYGKLREFGYPVVFQQSVDGIEALVGFHNDKQFGWYLAVGMGGSFSDVLSDRAYCFLPASKTVISNAISRTKFGSLLSPQQKDRLILLLHRLQLCMFETQGLQEVEINPLFITETGEVAADMKRG